MPKVKPLQFNWDPAKAEKNLEKYGVDFEEAAAIFKDPLALYYDDLEHSQTAKREMVIGNSKTSKRLLTCFFERSEGAIRIIGVRASTHGERQNYDDNSETEYEIE
jgi:uncharacterized DUF497 family protein